jgi:pyrroline-5-carboxylate reductase
MNEKKVVSIIGPGVMAEAFIAGLLRNQVVSPESILASGPHLERVQQLHVKYGIAGYTDNAKAVENADFVILAVKPQKLTAVLKGLQDKIRKDALVISIVAGTSISLIQKGLNHQAVVRAMPNTPAQIGEGITVWTLSHECAESHKEQAREILKSFGEEVFVEEENYLDMATALSGTGPAYVFLFMEAMIDAGVHLGFPRRISEKLVMQTVRGSVDYYASKSDHPAQLRNEVTSPGGTSAEALYYLEKAGFRTAISRAVWAAYQRSQELGKGKSSQIAEKG